jgi:hypothetical protein
MLVGGVNYAKKICEIVTWWFPALKNCFNGVSDTQHKYIMLTVLCVALLNVTSPTSLIMYPFECCSPECHFTKFYVE